MKWEKWGYLIAFLCGVVLGNLLENNGIVDSNIVNRNNMMLLYFDEIITEAYFVQVLFLRFQTVITLWILCRFMPERMVLFGFGSVISFALGSMIAISILANGIWGMWFVFCALMPHGVLYWAGFYLWGRICTMRIDNKDGHTFINYGEKNKRKERLLVGIFIILLVIGGSVCEAYFTPGIIENVIKS